MFVILIQSTVNTGKSTVSNRLKTLMRRKGFLVNGIDVSNIRASMRTLFNYFEVKDKRTLEISSMQSWDLSYEGLKDQARLLAPILVDIVKHRHGENGKSVIFHGVPMNLEEFKNGDFGDKKVIKIFIDLDSKNHKKRIASQIKGTDRKLDVFDNIRIQHEKLKQDAFNANAEIFISDRKAHKKIFRLLKQLGL